MANKLENIKLFTNDHGIDMVEIKTDSYPVRVSLNKCASILGAKEEDMEEVQYKGRTLLKITHLNGKGSFRVGARKLNAVLMNCDEIYSLMKAVYEEAQA